MTEKTAKDILRAALEAKKAKQSQGKKNKKSQVEQGSMGHSQDVVQKTVVRRSSRGG